METSLFMEPLKLVYGVFIALLSVSPLIAVVWMFAWLKDIRSDVREIRAMLSRKFPEDSEES